MGCEFANRIELFTTIFLNIGQRDRFRTVPLKVPLCLSVSRQPPQDAMSQRAEFSRTHLIDRFGNGERSKTQDLLRKITKRTGRIFLKRRWVTAPDDCIGATPLQWDR